MGFDITEDDLIRRRLHNQRLARSRFRTPADIVVDGRLAGTWRRSVNAGAVVVDVVPYQRPTRAVAAAIADAAERLGRFMNLPVVVSCRN